MCSGVGCCGSGGESRAVKDQSALVIVILMVQQNSANKLKDFLSNSVKWLLDCQ